MVPVKHAEASAPAKIILFGEHAVVYGQPALAAPLSTVRAYARVTPAPAGTGLTLEASDLGERLTLKAGDLAPNHPIARAAALCLAALGFVDVDLSLKLTSQIPIASGLGSGAALTAALMRALSAALDSPLPNDQLNSLVYEIERDFHGTPSGIDNTVVVYERALFFVRSEHPTLLTVGQPFSLIVADTGVRSSTKDAVTGVRELVEAHPAEGQALLALMGTIAFEARRLIAEGHIRALGPLMLENHHLLQRITVSSPDLDRLVDAAMAGGALGAKLSGGGRGGNMIALCADGDEQRVNEALQRAGAANVLTTRIESHE
jgi:mevalonate kinase